MMRQYGELKRRFPDYLLLFRLGDFYELFFQDAQTASRLLQLTLTSRQKGEGAIPMAGIPHHAADGYIARLIRAGQKVAVCEQLEEPGRGAEDRPPRRGARHHAGHDHRHPVPRRRPQQLPARRARDRLRGRRRARGRVHRRLLGGRGAGGGGGAPRGRAAAPPRRAAARPERGGRVGRALGPRRRPGHARGRRGLRGPGRARACSSRTSAGPASTRLGRGRAHRRAAGRRGRARLPARDPGRVAGASHADPAPGDRRGDAARSDRGRHPRALRDGPGAHDPGLALRHARRHRARPWARGCSASGCSARCSTARPSSAARRRWPPWWTPRPPGTALRRRLEGVGDLERLTSRAALGVAHARDLIALRGFLGRLPGLAEALGALDGALLGDARRGDHSAARPSETP